MNPYKTYIVTYTATYEVEALDAEEAVVVAIDIHDDKPVGYWWATKKEN